MTYEELKIEANKMGYNLIKKKEYVPHKKCKCGKHGRVMLGCKVGSDKSTWSIMCEKCNKRTKAWMNQDDAWREWNKMQEE